MRNINLQADVQDGSLLMIRLAEEGNRWTALACVDAASGDRRRLLTPVRVQGGNHNLAWSEATQKEAAKQTLNLRNKIAALDRLALVSTRFSEHFSAARVFVFGDIAEGERESWWFCQQVLRLIEEYMDRMVIAQVDYDQRRLHPNMSGILDSMDFATSHEPSAMATVVSFQTILKYVRPPGIALTWGVKGAGHLGSRIIRLIAGRAWHVYVAERLPDRQSAIAQLDNVSIVDGDVIANVSADAIIFAADSGSLNMHVANVIAANERVAVFGGPEAGLDRHINAIQKLALADKWFVPSVLCGSLGLVSNLEEVLNHPLDIDAQAHRLESIVSVMAEQAYVRHVPFHEICSMVLRGIESI